MRQRLAQVRLPAQKPHPVQPVQLLRHAQLLKLALHARLQKPVQVTLLQRHVQPVQPPTLEQLRQAQNMQSNSKIQVPVSLLAGLGTLETVTGLQFRIQNTNMQRPDLTEFACL